MLSRWFGVGTLLSSHCVSSWVNVKAGTRELVRPRPPTLWHAWYVVWLAQAQANSLKVFFFISFFCRSETWTNCAYDGKLSFSYIKLQTPAVDLDYLYRWLLADSYNFIIPQELWKRGVWVIWLVWFIHGCPGETLLEPFPVVQIKYKFNSGGCLFGDSYF